MLPSRRVELYLAQIALVVAKTAGAKDVDLRDFLFDPDEELTTDDVHEFFDFKPRNK